MSEQTSTTSPW